MLNTEYTLKAYSIDEFCREFGISRATFYNLLKAGDGPATIKIGRRRLIPAKAAFEWLQRLEAQS